MAQKIDTHHGSVTISQLEGQTANTPILDLAQFILPGLTKVVEILPTPLPTTIKCSTGSPHEEQLSHHFFPAGNGESPADQGWWGDGARKPPSKQQSQQSPESKSPGTPLAASLTKESLPSLALKTSLPWVCSVAISLCCFSSFLYWLGGGGLRSYLTASFNSPRTEPDSSSP